MPGRRLSQDERNLLAFWQNPPVGLPKPLLRQVRIEGGPGLRGVQRLGVTLPYPLTAICGRNGVGKSTVLGLAALSAAAPNGWSVFWGNARPRTTAAARVSYSFGDFFHRRPGDAPIEGLRLAWVSVDRGNEIEWIEERRGNRWRRVQNVGRQQPLRVRPEREVDFLPMSRMLPPGEHGVARSVFSRATPNPTTQALTAPSLQKLSYVMGRQYGSAEIRFLRGLGLAACEAGVRYSGFDMGGGEASVIALLLRAQGIPIGGLLLIEEVELGLHAEAQARLVEVLLGECRDRRVQIVCTTHSEVILDRLPRQARVLLRKNGVEHEAVTNVSTRFAVHEMAGEVQPELMVFAEDALAVVVIGEALAGASRHRVVIRDVGSNATLARQAVAHARTNAQPTALSVFDGDCTDADVNGWIAAERGTRTELQPQWLVLPGNGLPPERWLLRELSASDAYRRELARELNCTEAVAADHVAAVAVELNHHDCGHTLGRRTGLADGEAARILVRSVARTHPALEPLRQRVATLLGN